MGRLPQDGSRAPRHAASPRTDAAAATAGTTRRAPAGPQPTRRLQVVGSADYGAEAALLTLALTLTLTQTLTLTLTLTPNPSPDL